MKVLMVGAGAVGGYFGARLAVAGEDVGFLARGAQLARITSRGLTVESPLGDVRTGPLRAAESAADLGTADVVFLAVKLGDTEAAVEAARDGVGPETVVASLQNGLAADDILIPAFGRERVAGGVVYIAAALAAPGLVRHTGRNQRILLGELPRGRSARLEAVVAMLAGAGIDAELTEDITRARWDKFIFLVGLSATTALTGETIGAIRADADLRAFLRAAMEETVAVARARGLDLPEGYVEERLAFADTLPESMTSSMYHDLVAGKPLEVEWLSGAVARMGAGAGVATPVNATVYAALKGRSRGSAGTP